MDNYIDWQIISKSFRKNLSLEEQQHLDEWLAASPRHQDFYENAIAGGPTNAEIGLDPHVLKCRKEQLFKHINAKQIKRRELIVRWSSCAAMVAFIIGAALFFRPTDERMTDGRTEILSQLPTLPPGGNKATLTLADGRQVALDSLEQKFVSVDGSKIQNKDNTLIYAEGEAAVPVYNTISIPRGGEYQLVLSDGSKVWINSCTEIRYPVAFSPEERVIYLSGEAYFEVKKDKRPFKVLVNDLEVKVYGTSFNVNAYTKERVEATLLEGKIGLQSGNMDQETVLHPSEQACYQSGSKQINVKKVNAYDFIAWKNGEFVFNDQTIEEIMNRLSVWYDIEVKYENPNIKKMKFTGVMMRYATIDKILHYIEETATIHFKADDRVIVVK